MILSPLIQQILNVFFHALVWNDLNCYKQYKFDESIEDDRKIIQKCVPIILLVIELAQWFA